MSPRLASTLNPPGESNLPDAPADALSRFLGMVSPEAMQEALDALGYSLLEHVQHAVSLARNDSPKVKATGLNLLESMHERRLRHSGHSREVTLSYNGPDVRAHVSARGINTDNSFLPPAPLPVEGLVIHRPGNALVSPEPSGPPPGGDDLAVPAGPS